MERITTKKLDYLIERLNDALGHEREPHSVNNEGKLISNVGTFYIGKANGGYQVERIDNISGGCSVVVEYRGTARETYLVLRGILEGIQFAKHNFYRGWLNNEGI